MHSATRWYSRELCKVSWILIEFFLIGWKKPWMEHSPKVRGQPRARSEFFFELFWSFHLVMPFLTCSNNFLPQTRAAIVFGFFFPNLSIIFRWKIKKNITNIKNSDFFSECNKVICLRVLQIFINFGVRLVIFRDIWEYRFMNIHYERSCATMHSFRVFHRFFEIFHLVMAILTSSKISWPQI